MNGFKMMDNAPTDRPTADQITADKTTTPNLRILLLLEAIGNATRPISVADLAYLLALPKPTTHRLVKTLLNEGFLEKQGSQLAIAKRATTLAANLTMKNSGNMLRHQILRALARETGETINYVVPTENGMTYSDRVETDWHFRVMLPVGTYVPFYCTASGKSFLASLRKSQLEKLIDTMVLRPHTPQTITDKTELIEAVKQVRKQGYSIDHEELYNDMLAIAVPVMNHSGHYVGAVAIHGPRSRFSYEKAISYLPSLKKASQDITEALFDTSQ